MSSSGVNNTPPRTSGAGGRGEMTPPTESRRVSNVSASTSIALTTTTSLAPSLKRDSAAIANPKKKRGATTGGGGGGGAGGSSSVHVVNIDGDDGGFEMRVACHVLQGATVCRSRYKSIDMGQQEPNEKLPRSTNWKFVDGVMMFSGQVTQCVPWAQYYKDVTTVLEAASHAQCQATARYRLQVLEEKFNLYKLNNAEIEQGIDRYRKGGGVYANTTKVDNSVNLNTSMNAFELLQYIQRTHSTNGNDVVRLVGEKREPQTLARTFEVLDVQDPGHLTVEGLGLHSSNERTQFAFLDPNLNRAGRSSAELLRIFLTRNEVNNGLFLAGAVKPNLTKNDNRTAYIQCTEYGIEVNGYDDDEWEKLAKWMSSHSLSSYNNNSWSITVPREVDPKERSKHDLEFHQRFFQTFFTPLINASLAPEDPKNIELAELLRHVGCFVIASNEESREADFASKVRPPTEIPWKDNVSDLYFAYYFWANLTSLNCLRKRLNLNTFQLRAVSRENSRHVDVLAYSFLMCHSISHGNLLDEQPVLQYLYGIHNVGVCMSPLANNAHGTTYFENPFPVFFRRGLRVSLCTDHPLLFHHSGEPLIEEYGSASKLYKMNGVDMCEVSRNSALLSAFPESRKRQWLGERYLEGPDGNQLELSNVPNQRIEFRVNSWADEVAIIQTNAGHQPVAASTRSIGGAGGPASDSSMIQPQPSSGGFSSPYHVVDPNVNFPRATFVGPQDRDSIHTAVAQQLFKALELRKEYAWDKVNDLTMAGGGKGNTRVRIEDAFKKEGPTTSNAAHAFNESEWMFKTVEGVVVPHEVHQIPRLPKDMYRYEDFKVHVSELKAITSNVHVKTFAKRRLHLLEHKFKLHLAVNHSLEAGTTTEKLSQNRDFYQTTKVDTNVRMESGMTARQLLNFIVAKASNNGDDIVNQAKNNEPQTLRQLLKILEIHPDQLTVDDLNVQVDTALGVASEQFTPEARDALLTLVLKTDNAMKGRYFAELTKLTFDNFTRDKFTFAENRLPIYGANGNEWDMLSNWFDTHGMACNNNQWTIQIPRIYGYLRKRGKVSNFAEYLEHIFKPLWSVSLHPSGNPRLFHFVDHIAGFDCVENERKVDVPLLLATAAPQEWVFEEDPPYNYYMYHVWANIYSLNEFRMRRNFSTFSFRPSCGENGSLDHLIGGFLLANKINYGVKLKDDVVMQYLFYLSQIGVAVSPLSNNTKVMDYLDNPFPDFFRRGLNVSLSTDGPLLFHHTQEPLIEEYSIASKVWKLSPNDMCEIARNSVLQSGFPPEFKKERLGPLYFLSSSKGNNPDKSHLSNVRVAYRWETYHSEMKVLEHVSGFTFPKAMLNADEESKKISELEQMNETIETELGGIIDVNNDQAGVNKLQAQRQAMQKQIEELVKSQQDLLNANRNLKDRLSDELSRDQQAQQLRKHHFTAGGPRGGGGGGYNTGGSPGGVGGGGGGGHSSRYHNHNDDSDDDSDDESDSFNLLSGGGGGGGGAGDSGDQYMRGMQQHTSSASRGAGGGAPSHLMTAQLLHSAGAMDQGAIDAFAASPSINITAQQHLLKQQEARHQHQRHLIESPENFFEAKSRTSSQTAIPPPTGSNNQYTSSSSQIAAAAIMPVRRESFKQLAERMTVPHQPPSSSSALDASSSTATIGDRLGIRDITKNAYKELAGLTAKLNAEKAASYQQQNNKNSSGARPQQGGGVDPLVPAPPPRKRQ